MKKTILFLTVLTLFFYSCKEEDDTCGCVPPPNFSFKLLIQDKDGNDLLSPDVENSYKHTDISFYTKNKKEIINLDNSSNFIDKSDLGYRLRLEHLFDSAEVIDSNNRQRHYLQLTEQDVDTIDVESVTFQEMKIWYNGKFAGNVDNNAIQLQSPIIIIKNITETTEETEVE